VTANLTCRSSGTDVRRILEIFSQCKGKPSIVYEHRPHLGSNRLPAVVKALRRRIVAAGGEFRFECRLEDIDFDDAVAGPACPRPHDFVRFARRECAAIGHRS